MNTYTTSLHTQKAVFALVSGRCGASQVALLLRKLGAQFGPCKEKEECRRECGSDGRLGVGERRGVLFIRREYGR